MEKSVLEAIKALWDTDKATVMALITQGEGGAEGFALKLLQEAGSKLTGFAAILYGLVEPTLASYVSSEFAQYGPAFLYGLVDNYLAEEIAKLPG